jgi:hypothetical protein
MTSTSRFAVVVALALPLAPLPAAAAEEGGQVVITLHGGGNHYDAYGLKRGIDSARLSNTPASTEYGAMVHYRISLFSLGLIGDVTRPDQGGDSTALGVVGGLGIPLPGQLRLDGLAELGGRHHGDVLKDSAVVRRSTGDAWLLYVGLRPMVSYEFGDSLKGVVGVYGYARWDVTSQNVTVTLAGASADTSYKLGGTQFGLGLNVGLAF